MEHTYQYAWIIPLLPLPVPMGIGLGLIFFPTATATKNLRRMWSFHSVFLLSIVMVFSADLSIQLLNRSSIYQYISSWTINNDFSLEFGYLIDPLTSIMSILITTIGVMVLIYSDNYMFHDQGYLRFFAYMSFFNASMLGLVTSSNLIQIYLFWELVGMCSYLLIGFWFTRPLAANACQKAFVTNRIGDFGLLLGILGLYWITGSFEFRDLFEIFNNFISTNGVHFLFGTLCVFLLFSGAVAKSAQFPLHVWLPDAMEGPTPISALIHAATMVAAGIFLVARLFPLFLVIPYIMNFISLLSIITVLLGATLALAQNDIKRSLAYSTMSQLGYMMLALGMGSYRTALFHLITHAYSKALLFLGSGSIIHSMEPIVGYSPNKSQNMVLMGGLIKYVPITKTGFFLGTLSLCGIPPLACFWSKDEILTDSWLYSQIVGILACFTAGLTAFYMFRIYLLTFEGHLNSNFQNYSGKTSSLAYSISFWGKESKKKHTQMRLLTLLPMNNNASTSFLSTNPYRINDNVPRPFMTITAFDSTKTLSYPHEVANTMLFPLLLLLLVTFFVGGIGIPFTQEGKDLDILSKSLNSSINLLHKNFSNSLDWYEFFTNATFSISIAFFGIFIAFLLYKPVYSAFKNLNLINKKKRGGSYSTFFLGEKIINIIYNWSYNRGYIDYFYRAFLTPSIRGFAEFVHFLDRRIVDAITNGVGVMSFFIGEVLKYVGNGRISSYLFLYFLFLIIYYTIFKFIVF
uniref:NAD(P)H-quinone oxidoreductase subunit 5 n=1 Tax=Phedimus odontophyllus TaxID=2596667 RepID=UPI002027A9CE|nr:NAD(P)H-quinone oxidoreductase subunit 5 [Phedimus odontophyllus]YP_010400604.1 NAD(P)H-quinone oxidoreductase subunit 5 [Phedimus yangshanicus]UQS79166.1 NAD(P)H-quinone oxidoreductase subunit 5 [Phedimus yangshanicus]UQS79251.1 NAD(P)H-quinone oxidoreductase subunit 5 [Phedimus odontophyllus]